MESKRDRDKTREGERRMLEIEREREREKWGKKNLREKASLSGTYQLMQE